MPFYVHLRAKILVHLQVQQIQILCALYAVHMMPFRTFILLGHGIRLNPNWILKMIGGAISSFYHKSCSTNLYNQSTKIKQKTKKKQKEECKGRIDIDHVKAVVWDKVIAFMNKVFWFTRVRKYIPWLFIRVQNFHKKSYYMIWWKFDKEGTRTWRDKTW